MTEPEYGTLAAIIPTKDPDPQVLARTVSSMGEQDYPIEEVVIVDASEPPIRVSSDDVQTRVLSEPGMPRGEARRRGMEATDARYVAHLDEDSIPLDQSYFREAMRRVQQPDVAAVGGTVFPLRGNADGQAIALLDRVNPTTLGVHHLVHEKRLCEQGVCFMPGEGRGEDISIRRQLAQHGRIEQMDEGMLKDLPTLRQELARDLVVGTVTGAVAGAVTGWVRDQLRGVTGRVREEVEEDLSA